MEKLLLLLLTKFLLLVCICAETQSAKTVKNKNYVTIRCGEGVMGWSCESLCLRNCKNYYVNIHDDAFYSIAKKLKYYGASSPDLKSSKKTNKDSLMEKNANKNLRKKRSPQFKSKEKDLKLLQNRYPRSNVEFRGEHGSEIGNDGQGMGSDNAERYEQEYREKNTSSTPADKYRMGGESKLGGGLGGKSGVEPEEEAVFRSDLGDGCGTDYGSCSEGGYEKDYRRNPRGEYRGRLKSKVKLRSGPGGSYGGVIGAGYGGGLGTDYGSGFGVGYLNGMNNPYSYLHNGSQGISFLSESTEDSISDDRD